MGDGPYFLFPTLTCGVFVFSSVSAPPPSSSFLLLPVLPVLFTHSLTHPLTHSLTQSLTDSLTHCQGVGCTPRGSAGVPGSPLLLRGRRGGQCALTHTLTQSLTHSLSHPSLTQTTLTSLTHTTLTHTTLTSLTHTLTHSPVHAHTYTHTPSPPSPLHHPSITPHHSPTITPPSLLSFPFPSCFSMLSLSLEKLVTCGVIRSYNYLGGS